MFIRDLLDSTRPYLDADNGGGGGDGNPETTDTDANAGGEPGGSSGDTEQPFATFKDEKSFMARVNRDARKQLEAKAKDLGFDSVADMEAAIKAAKEQADNEKSELEKAREAAQKAESDRQAALARANDRLIRAEVKSIAADLNIVDGDAAYALMSRGEVEVDDDGNVSGVKEALEALVKTKPYLVKAGDSASRSGGEFNGNDTSKTSMNTLIRKAAGLG